MSTNQHPHGGRQQSSHPLSQGDFNAVLQPASADPSARQAAQSDHSQKAVELIRQKVAALYGTEPDANQEMRESLLPDVQHSKHQQFMRSLHDSNRTQSEIQTEWHQYYLKLDDAEKREVWQEFYNKSAQAKQQPALIQPQYAHHPGSTPVATSSIPTAFPSPANNPFYAMEDSADQVPVPTPQPTEPVDVQPDQEQPSFIRQQIRDTISRRGSLKAKHHLQSLAFGLGFGALTLLIVLFSFFNEVVIAPFIQPSRHVSATPIITSPDGIAASDKDEVVIPKINVQIPLDFSAAGTDEKEFEAALDKGVAHYPTTALPGQKGNTSFFGHSSNNIFNPGKYKFAFVLLNELVPGDTFYINYKGVSYAYQVYDKKIVEATAVEILNPVEGKDSTAMLVTCDPPGTSLRRLAIWGTQVSPNPNSNIAATTPAASGDQGSEPALPGNGPTLWGRITSWITGN